MGVVEGYVAQAYQNHPPDAMALKRSGIPICPLNYSYEGELLKVAPQDLNNLKHGLASSIVTTESKSYCVNQRSFIAGANDTVPGQ